MPGKRKNYTPVEDRVQTPLGPHKPRADLRKSVQNSFQSGAKDVPDYSVSLSDLATEVGYALPFSLNRYAKRRSIDALKRRKKSARNSVMVWHTTPEFAEHIRRASKGVGPEEAAEILSKKWKKETGDKVGRVTVIRWTERGAIPHDLWFDGSIKIQKEDLDAVDVPAILAKGKGNRIAAVKAASEREGNRFKMGHISYESAKKGIPEWFLQEKLMQGELKHEGHGYGKERGDKIFFTNDEFSRANEMWRAEMEAWGIDPFEARRDKALGVFSVGEFVRLSRELDPRGIGINQHNLLKALETGSAKWPGFVRNKVKRGKTRFLVGGEDARAMLKAIEAGEFVKPDARRKNSAAEVEESIRRFRKKGKPAVVQEDPLQRIRDAVRRVKEKEGKV